MKNLYKKQSVFMIPGSTHTPWTEMAWMASRDHTSNSMAAMVLERLNNVNMMTI